jgi:hypothetical protein
VPANERKSDKKFIPDIVQTQLHTKIYQDTNSFSAGSQGKGLRRVRNCKTFVAVLALAATWSIADAAKRTAWADALDDRNLQQFLDLHLPPPDVSAPPPAQPPPTRKKSKYKHEPAGTEARSRKSGK